jgi:uncharacterized membrane protein
MISRKEKRNKRRSKRRKLIILSSFVFGIGYYLLNVVSTWFEVPLGNIFYVIVGCILMAVSGVYIGYTIKTVYFKKKKKRTSHFYLDDSSENPKQK